MHGSTIILECGVGAISAHKGERVIIPLNMAEGCVLGTGKGVSKYNYSAPHGAGRVFGRKELHRLLKNPDNKEITMENFKASMTGIYSTSIQPETIDESPFAYKKYDDIARHLTETIEVTYKEHEQGLIIEVDDTRDLKDIDGLQDYLLSIKDMATKDGYAGFAFKQVEK